MKKKITAAVASLMLAFPMMNMLPVSAAEIVFTAQCGDNIFCTIDNEGTLTLSGSGEMYDYDPNGMSYSTSGSVTVNEWVDKAVPWYMHNIRDWIKQVVIEEGITKIGMCAFMDCDNLVSVQFPDTLTEINEHSFLHCESLESIKLPDSLKSIQNEAFKCCTALKNPILPEGLEYIGTSAFEQCHSITEIAVPQAITNLKASVFRWCKSLRRVYILSRSCTIYYAETTISNVYGWSSEPLPYYTGEIFGYANANARFYANKYEVAYRNFEDYRAGDVDFSGSVDASDASKVLTEYASVATGNGSLFFSVQKGLADVNSDNTVDSSDASSVLAYYAYTATGGTGTIEEFLK